MYVCFLTETPSFREAARHLKRLDIDTLYVLGEELGLDISQLRRTPAVELPLQLYERWLRGDDDVLQTSGPPTWSSLVRALRSIGANIVAHIIERECK